MNEPDAPKPVEARDSLSVGASEDLVGLRSSGGGREGARVGDSEGNSLAVDLNEDGTIDVFVHGKSYPGRADEKKVCAILRNRLDAGRERWGVPEKYSGPEVGIDYVLPDLTGGDRLNIQVTRGVTDTAFWEELRHTGRAAKRYESIGSAADELWAAIDHKKLQPKRNIILALDYTQTPIGLESVRRSFKTRYARFVRGLGWREVWAVEVFSDQSWTYRLDEAD